jgi:hypothetical protein
MAEGVRPCDYSAAEVLQRPCAEDMRILAEICHLQ